MWSCSNTNSTSPTAFLKFVRLKSAVQIVLQRLSMWGSTSICQSKCCLPPFAHFSQSKLVTDKAEGRPNPFSDDAGEKTTQICLVSWVSKLISVASFWLKTRTPRLLLYRSWPNPPMPLATCLLKCQQQLIGSHSQVTDVSSLLLLLLSFLKPPWYFHTHQGCV